MHELCGIWSSCCTSFAQMYSTATPAVEYVNFTFPVYLPPAGPSPDYESKDVPAPVPELAGHSKVNWSLMSGTTKGRLTHSGGAVHFVCLHLSCQEKLSPFYLALGGQETAVVMYGSGLSCCGMSLVVGTRGSPTACLCFPDLTPRMILALTVVMASVATERRLCQK